MLNKKRNIIVFSLFSLLLILIFPLVSSNGLKVQNQTDFSVSKLINENKNITIVLKNEEPYKFVNISFENNQYITMNKITELLNGNSVTFIATVFGSNNFNGPVRIKGFYESQLGQQDVTHNIEAKFDIGLSICDFTAIQGDQVVWTNSVNDIITLKNIDTGNIVTTISQNSTYLMNLDTPQIFRYVFERHGFQFTNVCTITTVSDTGFVNNPALDGIINLNLQVNFIPTTITTTFLTASYTIDFFDSVEDLFQIKNTGSDIAKNITLSGEWFSFSSNKFDLLSGQSKNIAYTISPSGITSTNQTNITYVKNISISGNFVTVVQPINIFIKPANVNEFGVEGGGGDLTDNLVRMIKEFCIAHPDDTVICPQAKVIFRTVNETNSTASLEGLIRAFYNFIDQQAIQNNIQKEQTDAAKNAAEEAKNNTQSLNQSVTGVDKKLDDITSSSILLAMTYGTILIIAVLGALVYFRTRNKQIKELEQYY